MSKTVFVLGAGASAEAGAPVMKDFLAVAEAVGEQREAQADREYFELVFKAIRELTFITAKAAIDLQNLEAVFGIFEMAGMCERLGDLSGQEVSKLAYAMRRVILRTLELCVRLPIRNQVPLAPPPYGDFLKLTALMTKGSFGSVSFITFNYDIALDVALHRVRQEIDYCLGPPTGGVEVMKLHGSINWTRCPKCEEIVPLTLGEYFRMSFQVALPLPLGRDYRICAIGSELSKVKHCEPCVAEPVIVPPTWNKAEYRRLAKVWQRAAKHLSEAENIFVVGYSLPPADEFFRYLYAVGTYAKTPLRRFYVIDPNEKVLSEYQKLLGPVAGQPGVLKPLRCTFDAAIRQLADSLLQTQIDREVT